MKKGEEKKNFKTGEVSEKGTPRTLSLTSKKSAKYRNPDGPAKYFYPYKSRTLDEIVLSDVDIDPKELEKDELSEVLWDGDKIKPEVRKSLLVAAKKFYEFLEIKAKLKDVVVIGSMAHYTYHDGSDIDVHLVVDYDEIDDNEELVSEFLHAKKTIWNTKYDLKIEGHDIEMYTENLGEGAQSNGRYSLAKNKWIDKPEKKNAKIDLDTVKKKVVTYAGMIDKAEKARTFDQMEKLVDRISDKIWNARQKGLETSAEEFSPENLAFKYLRNIGYLDKLTDMKVKSFNDYISIDEKATTDRQRRFFQVVDKIQKGEIPPTGKAGEVAKDMKPSDVDDFAFTTNKEMEAINEGTQDLEDNQNSLKIEDGIKDMSDEKIEVIKDFISFTRFKLKIENPVAIILLANRTEGMTTAAYSPYYNENYIYCQGRSLVDILKSIAHELTHNRQMEVGVYKAGESIEDIDSRPNSIEGEANSIAGALIKDYAKNYDNRHIYEL